MAYTLQYSRQRLTGGPKMAMTSEERSERPLCGAKKRNGELCRAYAGQHTDHFGFGKCKYHGGNTPTHKKQAVKLEAERAMAETTMGQALDVRPDQALLGVLRATAGHTAWLAAEVANLDGVDGERAPVLLKLYGDERDRLARVAEACLSTGISKVEVEVTQQQTEFIVKVVNCAMSAIGGLSNEQKKEFSKALRREFAAAEAQLEPRKRAA
jgi:hypothetical protein